LGTFLLGGGAILGNLALTGFSSTLYAVSGLFGPIGLGVGAVIGLGIALWSSSSKKEAQNKREEEVNAPKRPDLLNIIDQVNARIGSQPKPEEPKTPNGSDQPKL
jgi:hypothetical protein